MLTKELYDSVIQNFYTELDKNNEHLKMDGVIVSQGDNYFETLFNEKVPTNNVRSLGKAVLSMCIGALIERKTKVRRESLSLDMKIWPFFENKVQLKNKNNLEYLKALTLRHLMTHTMGYEVGLLFSKDIKEIGEYNLLNYVFNYDIKYLPGTHFVYSNVGPYVISALLQNELGKSLSVLAKELIFDPLGISSFEWVRYGRFVAGCTGLDIGLRDLHKIAKLLVDNGEYNSKQIVPKDWIFEMTSAQILTPNMYDSKRAFPKYAYGYYLWICENKTFYCDGTGGQYMILLPEEKIVIVTMGHQNDMKPIGECFRPLLEVLERKFMGKL